MIRDINKIVHESKRFAVLKLHIMRLVLPLLLGLCFGVLSIEAKRKKCPVCNCQNGQGTNSSSSEENSSSMEGTSSLETGVFDPNADALAAAESGEPCRPPPKDSNGYCGDDAYSYYSEFILDEDRFVVISGAPDHPAEFNQSQVNPNTRCKLY